ncbi:MAG: tyrosine-protein kinase family protein [Syntrophobacteraceae bacterium]
MSTFEEAFKKTKKQHLEEQASVVEEAGEETAEGGLQDKTGEPPWGAQEYKGSMYPPVLRKTREYFDGIWGNIILHHGGRPGSLLFCGTTHEEGVTFVSFHLALFLSIEYGLKVLYVDTCVEKTGQRPNLYRADGHPGLAAYLMGKQPLEGLIVKTEYGNLCVVPAGSKEMAGMAGGIISGRETLERFAHYCEQYFDLVIYDGLPASMYPSVIGFARLVDQVVLVSRYAYSRREVVRMVSEKLLENNVAIGGIILNDREYPVPHRIYQLFR